MKNSLTTPSKSSAGDRIVCVAKEISKMFERFFVGRLADVAAELKKSSTKGEFVVIVAPDGFTL